ncbi:hypothetical protein Tco_0019590 [Tanacetum coccineum]
MSGILPTYLSNLVKTPSRNASSYTHSSASSWNVAFSHSAHTVRSVAVYSFPFASPFLQSGSDNSGFNCLKLGISDVVVCGCVGAGVFPMGWARSGWSGWWSSPVPANDCITVNALYKMYAVGYVSDCPISLHSAASYGLPFRISNVTATVNICDQQHATL